MLQKILKVGSSAAVTIPKKALEELGLSVGDLVQVSVSAGTRKISIEPPVMVDKELIEWTNEFIKKYRPALEALAKK